MKTGQQVKLWLKEWWAASQCAATVFLLVQLHTQESFCWSSRVKKRKKKKQALRRDNTSAFATHHGYFQLFPKFLQTSLQLCIPQDTAVWKSRSNTVLKKQHWSHNFFWKFWKLILGSKNALVCMTGRYSMLHSKLDISILWQSSTLHGSWKGVFPPLKGFLLTGYQTTLLYHSDQLLHKQEVQIVFKN